MTELMINDRVPYMFGNAIYYGEIAGIKIVTEIMRGERVGVFTERTYTVVDPERHAVRDGFKPENFEKAAAKRLEQIRRELDAERISYGEIAELQGLTGWMESGDVQLLEAADVPEEEYEEYQEYINKTGAKTLDYRAWKDKK